MRPHLFRRGNGFSLASAPRYTGASMRPHLFRRGNQRREGQTAAEYACFNEAPPIQAGKPISPFSQSRASTPLQ